MSQTFNEWLAGVADAIRSKKGTTDLIKPIDFASEIESIEAGGSGNVVTVTFYDYDGSFLYEKPTIAGDDCVDVVAKGLLSKPTRPSSNEYNYSYTGWSLTKGGNANSNALLNVTENRSVYAAYNASVRYYTVNFYDGSTLVDTVQVTYGSTATTDYTKVGYSFNGWTPSNVNITKDTDCYGEWSIVALSSDSWATISQRSVDGTAKDYYKVGDTKEITLDGNEVLVAIAGFDIHRDTNGNKNGITFIQVSGHTKYSPYNFVDNNSKNLKSKLNQDLQDVMKETQITTMRYDSSSNTYVENTSNIYTFAPELHNYNADLPNNTRTDVSAYSSFYDIYENPYDKTVFPIFDGKTVDEFKTIMNIESSYLISRSWMMATKNGTTWKYPVCLNIQDSGLTPLTTSVNSYGAFCFRV